MAEGAGISALDLYHSPLAVVAEIDVVLTVVNDPLVKATVQAKEQTRREHEELRKPKSRGR